MADMMQPQHTVPRPLPKTTPLLNMWIGCPQLVQCSWFFPDNVLKLNN